MKLFLKILVCLIIMFLLIGCQYEDENLVFMEMRKVNDERFVYIFKMGEKTRKYVSKSDEYGKMLEKGEKYSVTYYYDDQGGENYSITEVELDN